MICINDIHGRAHYLALAAIASVAEAGASSQWHGIRAYVKLFDGKVIEARETAHKIAEAMQEASK